MYRLCADTSGGLLCFTLANNNRLAGSHQIQAGRKMNELFFPELDLFLSKYCDIAEIDEFTIITGPGSFTGVRIGAAAFSGMAYGLGKKLTGLTSLDAAALLSGKSNITVCARLKLDEFVFRRYCFEEHRFSELAVTDISKLPEECICVNSGSLSTKGYETLTGAILAPGYERFLTEGLPEYVRPSEAEINFDKKSASN